MKNLTKRAVAETGIEESFRLFQPEKTTNILRRHQRFPHEIGVQTVFSLASDDEHRNSILMTGHYLNMGSASDQLKKFVSPIRRFTLMRIVTLWNFCARFLGVVLWANSWWCGEMPGCCLRLVLFLYPRKGSPVPWLLGLTLMRSLSNIILNKKGHLQKNIPFRKSFNF